VGLEEFHLHMPEPTATAGARCMDCGVPFCHTGQLSAGWPAAARFTSDSRMDDLVYRGL